MGLSAGIQVEVFIFMSVIVNVYALIFWGGRLSRQDCAMCRWHVTLYGANPLKCGKLTSGSFFWGGATGPVIHDISQPLPQPGTGHCLCPPESGPQRLSCRSGAVVPYRSFRIPCTRKDGFESLRLSPKSPACIGDREPWGQHLPCTPPASTPNQLAP